MKPKTTQSKAVMAAAYIQATEAEQRSGLLAACQLAHAFIEANHDRTINKNADTTLNALEDAITNDQ